MHRNLASIGLATILVAGMGTRAVAQDVLISGKVGLVKTGKLAKLVSKDATLVTLPTAGSGNDPTLNGAQVQIFDTLGSGGSFTHTLPAIGWKGLGNPAGSKGYKYVGSHAGDSVCTSVQVKPGKAKVKCKGSLGLTTPFAGLDGIIISMPAGTATLRYCAAFGGTTKKNDATELKRKDALAPGSCPFVAPTPTVTNTPVNTSTNTPASTATVTNTPASTATATNTGANTATRTATNTPVNTPTNTATRTNSPTPTVTVPVCPLTAPARYTQTTTGGVLKVATFASFAFPAGGVTVQDVGAGNANCVHSTVVPFPGGFSTPPFCVPALGATTTVTQSGCGVGEIDSNGGSDFTVNENGDTSEQTVCGVHQTLCPGAGPAPDSSGRVDVTVGNGTTDVCTGGGTANAIVTIPVNTLTWVAADASCPDTDGTFNPGTDTQLAAFPQTLDLTTDTAVAKFTDLGTSPPDPDGCTKSGLGPAQYAGVGPNGANGFCQGAGVPSACCTGVNTGTCTGPTGKCLNIAGMTVNVAAAGTIFSSGGPTYDLLFSTVQNSTVSAPAAFGGATCGSPPLINFTGTATRCLVGP